MSARLKQLKWAPVPSWFLEEFPCMGLKPAIMAGMLLSYCDYKGCPIKPNVQYIHDAINPGKDLDQRYLDEISENLALLVSTGILFRNDKGLVSYGPVALKHEEGLVDEGCLENARLSKMIDALTAGGSLNGQL